MSVRYVTCLNHNTDRAHRAIEYSVHRSHFGSRYHTRRQCDSQALFCVGGSSLLLVVFLFVYVGVSSGRGFPDMTLGVGVGSWVFLLGPSFLVRDFPQKTWAIGQ